jgi:hypothetical protein
LLFVVGLVGDVLADDEHALDFDGGLGENGVRMGSEYTDSHKWGEVSSFHRKC